MRGRNRLVTFQARFHHTALVMAPGFHAVLVAQVDFDPGNMVCQMTQGALHRGFGLLNHCFVTFNVMIGIDLDFHDFIYY
jgi:hypothetical protein